MNEHILVLGASGYIGGQLTERLLTDGYVVRAAGRSLEKLKNFSWCNHLNVELVEVDVLNKESLAKACATIDTVYYLVHSMNPEHKNFEQADKAAAQNMVEAAAAAKLKRIIYLGGLGENNNTLSRHLRSRMEVSEILHSGQVAATTLRAAMIIGKGSISFEILRTLVDRLPIMITPRWVHTESQPIAVENVLEYLLGCLKHPQTAGQVLDIGGPDIISYDKLMEIYAEEAGLSKRFVIPVGVLTPTLSSYWIQMVTSYPSYIARPLAEGLRNKVVCQNDTIKNIIPQKLLNCREAIRQSIKKQ